MKFDLLKKSTSIVSALALAMLPCAGLTGCGSSTALAATCNGEEITEETITNYIEGMMTYYGYDEDTDSWAAYICEHEYDSDYEADEDEDADEEESEYYTEDEITEAVVALREYVIDIYIEEMLIEEAIEAEGISVSEDDLESYVTEIEAYYEYYYAGGLSGTFSSIVTLLGYSDEDEFVEECEHYLLEEALMEAVAPLSEDDEDSDYDYDEEAWAEYVDELYDAADIEIFDMPDNRSYDPNVIAEQGGFISEDGSINYADTEDEEDADDEDADDEATDEDADDEDSDDEDDVVYYLDDDGNIVDEDGNIVDLELAE